MLRAPLPHARPALRRSRRASGSERTAAAATPLRSGREYSADGFMAAEVSGDVAGERIRVEVGPVGERSRRTFVVAPISPQPSRILTVTLPRPLGCVFVPDAAGGVRIGELVPGSFAGRAAGVARLSPNGSQAPAVGDVLRAVTATVFAFTPQAQLLGELKGTKRTVVLFGADGQSWEKVFVALTQGLVADGPVTLILERPLPGSPAATWTPLAVPRPALEAARSGGAMAPVAAPVYGVDDEADAEAEAEAQAARRDRMLAVDAPGKEVSAAIFSTVGLLALLLLAGFFP